MASKQEEKPKTDEGLSDEWKARINRAGDVYFATCRRLASALHRLRRKNKKR